MVKREEYWKAKETIREKTGELPDNSFDFISIHNGEKGFSLVSPLVLCNLNGVCRPEFENDRFDSLRIAYKAAKMLSALYSNELKIDIPIVYCD
jgi:hypothetical protein